LVYGYPGGAIMPVYDELYKFKRTIAHVLVRHEQGATHAAQVARATGGKVGVLDQEQPILLQVLPRTNDSNLWFVLQDKLVNICWFRCFSRN
jgi:hypothetical protein